VNNTVLTYIVPRNVFQLHLVKFSVSTGVPLFNALIRGKPLKSRRQNLASRNERHRSVHFRFILSTDIRIRTDFVMRPRSSSRGRNTRLSASVTVTVTVSMVWVAEGILRYLKPFRCYSRVWRTDRQTDRQTDRPIAIACFNSVRRALKMTTTAIRLLENCQTQFIQVIWNWVICTSLWNVNTSLCTAFQLESHRRQGMQF